MHIRFGAVIVAAGISRRREIFDDLIKPGDMEFEERVVTNFRRAGVNDIVMITGHRGRELEKKLKNQGVVFVRNEDYETAEMFESGLIGLRYMHDRCSHVFFCPVDVPFFTVDTVLDEMANAENADFIIPGCNGRYGHPILLSSKALEYALQYNGEDGMKGAYRSFVSKGLGNLLRISVNDLGAVMAADTKEDYEKLLKLHNARLLRPEISVKICGNKEFLDGNAVMFLKQIEIFGSVREACKKCGISYSKGWKIINDCEKELGCDMVERQQGGKDGGRSALTGEGKKIIASFERLESEMNETVLKKYREIFAERIE